MPSSENARPDASPRQAENAEAGDCFKTAVYHIDAPDLFVIVDYRAKPEPYDWVVIKQSITGELVIALYEGQPYVGVVIVMEFYQLQQSEQWTPRIKFPRLDWPR